MKIKEKINIGNIKKFNFVKYEIGTGLKLLNSGSYSFQRFHIATSS